MEKDWRLAGAAALAYLGDSVIEVRVRTMLVEQGIYQSRKLNRMALSYVTAAAQAKAVQRILPLLTEEENGVYHRGRNLDHANIPKNATRAEYLMATGFEALFGYLHLVGDRERMDTLFRAAYPENQNPLSQGETIHEKSQG